MRSVNVGVLVTEGECACDCGIKISQLKGRKNRTNLTDESAFRKSMCLRFVPSLEVAVEFSISKLYKLQPARGESEVQ